jgi:hypothetical protein
MEIRKPDYLYPFKVWFSAIAIVAPFSITIYNFLFYQNTAPNSDNYSWVVATIPIGLICSLPVLVIYYVLFLFLSKRQVKTFMIKIILTIICVAGIIITFLIIGGTIAPLMSKIYSTSVILPSLIFKIYQNKKEFIVNGG